MDFFAVPTQNYRQLSNFFDEGVTACRTPHLFPIVDDVTAVPGSLIGEYLQSLESAPPTLA
jgi:hypothetical protein